MIVIKSKMGTIKSKIGRKFEQKRKAKWVKEKANLVKAYESRAVCVGGILCTYMSAARLCSWISVSAHAV